MTENKDVTKDEDRVANYNLDAYYGDNGGLGEGDRFKFAKQILFFLFILVIFVFSSIYYLVNYGSGDEEVLSIVSTILDITKTVVPSTVTLVLGFYFGQKNP